ncbi:MAG: metallophosphoesterase [Oscillospiraceae bacterium]|nr:metallophosphoesterase [Oscillospiraceae bacterium]
MLRKRIWAVFLSICLVLSLIPLRVHAEGSSFTADRLLCAQKPFGAMPNTLEAWLYFPANMDASTRGGVILGNYTDLGRGVLNFEIFSQGRPRIYYIDSTGKNSSAVFDSVNVYNGKWTHLAIVRNESTNVVTCYINGEAVESKTVVTESMAPLAAPVLGGDYRNGNGVYFRGQLRSVLAYSDARSAAEIRQDMTDPGNHKLLAHWDLSTSASSYADLSGNGYDVKPTVPGGTFRADQRYPVEQSFDTLPATYEAWVKFPADMGTARGGVILGNYDAGIRGVLNFEIYNSGRPRLYCTETGGKTSNLIFSSVNVYTGKWVHIAIVRDVAGGKAHCYIDGKLAESLDLSMNEYIPSTRLYIGGDARENNVQYFKGQLRSVSLYANVRTQAEIQADKDNIRNSEPLAVWDTRAHCSTYMDLSTHGYNANLEYEGMSFSANETYEAAKKFSQLPKTVEAWIHFPKSMDSSLRGGVILGNYEGSNAGRCNVEISTKGVPRLYFVNASGEVTNLYFSEVNVYTGNWLHLTVTYDKSKGQAHCYVNGSLKQSIACSVGDYAMTAPMVVGADYRGGNAQYFKGQIRSVAVYKDVRTAEEVATDMNKMGQGDPLAYWNMQTNAESYSDLSGQGYHLNRSAYWISEKEAVTGYDYTFAVIGDTQKVTYYDYQNGTKNLNKIYAWILSQKEAQNIQYVMGLGDITEKGTIDAEWDIALEAIGQLNGQIPYSLVRGNHDNSAKMNSYLTDLSKTPYSTTYEGSYDSTVNNTWRTITVGSLEIPYLIFTLDYGPTDKILKWAGKIIEEHPDHNVIITTHAYLYRDGTTLDSGDVCPPSKSNASYNNGDQVWEKFARKYENIVLVLSGHDPCSQVVYRQDAGDHGNIVTQMLIDPQGVDTSTLTGAVALLHFSADGRKVDVEYYATIQEKYFMSSNQFSMTIDGVEPLKDRNISISHSLNLASEISVNYAVPTASLANYDSYYLECRLPMYESNSLVGEKIITIEPEVKGNLVYFTMDGLHALQINDEITAVLHMEKDGVSYVSAEDVYSIATYAYRQLNSNSSTQALKKLCADLLQYGAAAQLWKGYGTDRLATANMTENQKVLLSDLSAVSFNDNRALLSDLKEPEISWVGRSLSLESKVVIRWVFDASRYDGDPKTLSLRLTYTDHTGKQVSEILSGSQVYNLQTKTYVFDLDSLTAAQMRCVVSAAVYEGDTRLSQTARYSIDSYGLNKTGALLTLCQAMIAYGDSAATFFS